MDITLSDVLFFNLFRPEIITNAITSPAIVIAFDRIKYRCPPYFCAGKILFVDTVHFQRVEKLSAKALT
ncbi:hypothetical protein DVG03_24525 [Salmonella enterica subsp. enterica serovar Java]|nr:hypothetical protein B6N51_09815 [Salmonella enterica subsp. enterica]EAA1317063.1 hypothetical protein [Salmonella enterica subsp. enterica serovar Java]EBY0109833.1 hypothetical protein [Salmonella enterica subsp. enterica serovar Bahati]MIO19929.1 hypothetical protein [Salmonella enterica subsp. enterica serovar Paratyphi C]PHM11943.1 hypothetical protein B6D48_23640 [Salmonella enterica subsp. enterica serovar Paratyphi B]